MAINVAKASSFVRAKMTLGSPPGSTAGDAPIKPSPVPAQDGNCIDRRAAEFIRQFKHRISRPDPPPPPSPSKRSKDQRLGMYQLLGRANSGKAAVSVKINLVWISLCVLK
ncbi:uncharacterized protein LOC103724111 [Phoenix dactylifera]|uniref:Uncharacterized protein LOC103724111 n=1 Tax=Phoenix dactylifera TaxID=42345 RepID=A0A8B7D595_PHODC|nr:uncharacterized protein LOC103724111 [Phoenix dactylifera]